MPRSAWVEIRGAAGELLVSIPARIESGTVSADLPAFPPNTRSSVRLCTDEEDGIPPSLQELPTTPRLLIVQMG
jgi:hypothetical protein